MRRLYFDLIGLPPDPAEVDAFVASPSSENYERLVDDLLRSPHFGERLAMYWLDLVRYADTVGYHGDQDVSVSPYRDYVINAFNNNLPFDQFTREQLAGDLLDSPSVDQLVASGYNRLGMMSAEGGVQPEEYLAKYAADRVRNASTVWLGSTLGCAECHDHKFDPFTTQDFYQFAAFFADIKERGLYSGANQDGNWGPQVSVPDPVLAELLRPIDGKLERLRLTLDTMTPELVAAQRQWEADLRRQASRWNAVTPIQVQALHDTELSVQADGSVLASGPSPGQNTYTLTVSLPEPGTTAFCIEVLPDMSLPNEGPGRAANGNFVLSEVRALAIAGEAFEGAAVEGDAGNGNGETAVTFSRAMATFEQAADKDHPYGKWSAESAIDGDVKGANWGWAILPEVGQPQALIVELEEPLDARTLRITIEQNHSNPQHTLGKFRLWSTASPPPPDAAVPWGLPSSIREVLAVAAQARSQTQQDAISKFFRNVAKELEPAREELTRLEAERADLVAKHTRTSLITVAVEPREMRVLHRGNWMDKSGKVVSPSVPHFLDPLDEPERATRLDLANWLVDRQNPLTARVLVNRLWKLYFGTGLSKVLDDIGSQGELPSHPELLDTLAVEFVESGWDMKHMIKLIVMSQTYRQSSLPRPELQKSDPYNRLLARQSRYRLDAEMIRDNALAVSGLLVHQVGGRSAKPYQPAGLLRHLNFPTREYQADVDENQYRRGVYTHWQRQFLHPAMQAFDAPAREECTAERPRSNTPLAALVLLNDPSYVEAARVSRREQFVTLEVPPQNVCPGCSARPCHANRPQRKCPCCGAC